MRDFPFYALAKLELSADGDSAATKAAEEMVRCAFTFQTFTRGASGADQGVFAFHVGDPPNIRDNSNEFALESLEPLLLDHAAQLSPDFLAFLEPRVLAAAEVILDHHDVCPAYTNICLMQAAELTALGRYYAQSHTAATHALGERMLTTDDDTVLPDYLDAPATEVDAGDFQKVSHLPLSPVAAQKGGAALVLLRVPAKDPHYRDAKKQPLALKNLSTSILFPAHLDELLIDGVNASVTADTRLPPRPVITARAGSGAVSVAVLSASGVECLDGSGAMVEDVEAGRVTIHAAPFQPTTGGAHPPPMIRVAVYHSTHVPADTAKWKPCFARLALLVVADRCDGEGCAAALGKAVSRAAAGAVASWDPRTQAWSVSVHGATAAGPGPNLLVSRGPSPRDMSRQVDGKEMVFAPLVVNGAPVSLGH